MKHRTVSLTLAVLLLLIQYPLWFGKGGWLRVWELQKQFDQQQQINEKLRLRNQQLDGEVRSLRDGLDAVEERARYELGMVKPDEVFVQLIPYESMRAMQP